MHVCVLQAAAGTTHLYAQEPLLVAASKRCVIGDLQGCRHRGRTQKTRTICKPYGEERGENIHT